MSDELVLPTFFVIGAAKAGTTSLHSYLSRHPEIAMTEPKEPHVLVGPDYRRRAHWYADLFTADRPVRGEASTGYSAVPLSAEVSGNIADLVPGARLVYLVRDPVERTLAHYAQAVTAGRDDRDLADAVRPEDPENLYVVASCYATQVEAYLRHFDQERILVLDSGALREDRRQALGRVFAHVGAEPGFWDEQFEREHQVRSAANVKLGPRVGGLAAGRAGAAYRRLLPEGARHRLRPLLRRSLGGREVRPALPLELRERLAERLAPEAERLRSITGQRFADWSV